MAIVDGIVGGLVAGLVVNVMTKLGTRAVREFGSAWRVKEEVEHLQNTVATIQDYLADAEQKQLTDNKVGIWLTRIKDAVYKADDIIDDFVTEAERRRLAKQDNLFKTSKSHSGFRFKTARRIKKVRETLGRIKDDQPSGLIHHIPEQNSGFIPLRPETHSSVYEGDVVFGRDEERDEIVKLLLDSSGGDTTVSVIPIIGMGGIGKTTFAKCLYNHDQVVYHFKENRWWVCVSNDDRGANAIQTITKKIIESVTKDKCLDLQMDLLRTRLGGHIGGKRFLLVLDDVWNEDANQWWELRGLLSGGASGSKIIVTTRSGRVGSITSTNSNSKCKLSELSYDHCWELFKSRAFSEAGDQQDPELVDIGRAIVRKCGGLPLAARVLGGLCYRANRQVWVHVRDHEIWKQEKNDILRELMISYNYLPIQLKNCFAYCSIFPKNYRIKKDMLIQYWIAHGLIYSSGDTESLEDVCNYYIQVLMSRSFFQEAELGELDNVISFKMHDLVNDLAKCVAGEEFFTVREDVKNFPKGIRHLFFDIETLSSHLTVIPKQIRTLVFSSKIENFVSDIFSRLKFLRVLQFRVLRLNDNCSDHLSNSIGNLKHLRYLEIEYGSITELPESITNLQNLQTLNLECEMLERLPGSIRKMINLKHINFVDSPLSHMPLGLKELTYLRTLSRFIVSNDNVGCELNELNGLINLGGTLLIANLDNVKNAKESEKTNLKTKSNLQRLSLYWRERTENANKETVDFEVLRNLEPHPNLKYLLMKGYLGLSFPCWMMDPLPSLKNVVEIRLDECERCEKLPPFRRLPSLKVLVLRGIRGARCFEDNLEQSSRMEWFPSLTELVIEASQKEWFPSLIQLRIQNAPNLESWVATGQQQQQQGLSLSFSFPCLVELRIWNCPKLKNMPPLRLPCIEDVFLYQCSGEVVHSVFNPTSSLVTLKRLRIDKCDDLECLPEYPAHYLSSLEMLTISRCESLKSWPNWLGHQLTSLRELHISCSSNLQFLPEQILHLAALQDLTIDGYSEETLPDWMENFTSFQILHLKNCPSLQILPEWVLRVNTTIRNLGIGKCPLLTLRYNKDTGDDRDKLTHIKSVYFW